MDHNSSDSDRETETDDRNNNVMANQETEKTNENLDSVEDNDEARTEGEHTPTEPAIGLLIDVGDSAIDFLAEHMGPGEREAGDGSSPSVERSMEASPLYSTSGLTGNEENVLRQSNSSNQSDESSKTTPEGSIASSDYNAESPVKGEVLYTPKRQFNMDINTYTPELSFDGMEGMSNPKLDGQSMKKPWQTWDSDSDDDFWNDDDDTSPGSSRSESAAYSRSSSYNKYSKPKTPPPKPVFNPFPRRKLKSEENRSRTRLKVGLYKVPTKGGQSQPMDHPVQRMVKLGW